MLVDTGDVVNTSIKQDPLWVISQYSPIVTKYLQYGKNIENEVVLLLSILYLIVVS